MQTEYWHTKYYSLLIAITAFLVTAEWLKRDSPLPANAEVTVQPEWALQSEGPPLLTYTKGSFFGVVEVGFMNAGEDVEYVVVLNDGSKQTIPRRRLRHRVWHRVAFLGVTNEKQHVALTTQAFHDEELEFWRCWHALGRDAALAYAAADRASMPCLVPSPDIDSSRERFRATRATREAAAIAAASAVTSTSEFNPSIPTCAAAVSTRFLATNKPVLAAHLATLDDEKFEALIAHSDNATHLKSSGNLHYWSGKQTELSHANFIKKIIVEYGCPGQGKGPWDGIGAVAKTKVGNDIVNEIPQKLRTTPSGMITSALEVAMHLRAVFSTSKWIADHAHMKINEMVVLYIDKDEIIWPSGEPPTYSTFHGISQRYSFLMRDAPGRVGGARFSCWCPPHCLAFETGEGMDELLDVATCTRRHLNKYQHGQHDRYGYEELTITCTQATGIANARARAKALWQELKRLLKAGKFAAVQARELWSAEEQVHMRPGHFWACQLGDASLLDPSQPPGSPILAGPFTKQQYWPPNEDEIGRKDFHRGITRYRYDAGECAILLRCYYHRTADDPEGLTFVRERGPQHGKILVVNSSELRAVQGRQECDFKLTLPKRLQPLRQHQSRASKKKQNASNQLPAFDASERWRIDAELDRATRLVCEAT